MQAKGENWWKKSFEKKPKQGSSKELLLEVDWWVEIKVWGWFQKGESNKLWGKPWYCLECWSAFRNLEEKAKNPVNSINLQQL